MCADDNDFGGFEEMLRSIAQEVGEQLERTIGGADLEDLAGRVGVDPERAREWADTAAIWMRSRFDNLGDEMASRSGATPPVPHPPEPTPDSAPAGRVDDPRGPATPDVPGDPLRGAAPHPLDMPTDEQGLALAAVDSGRWTLEPGSNALTARGEGPGPSDALGLARELRARDWIAVDGEITLAGASALARWLDSSVR